MVRQLVVAVMVLTLSLTAMVAGAVEKDAKIDKITTAKTKSLAQKKRYYEVMWAADAAFCEKVRLYADRKRADYVPSDIDFGNVKWTKIGSSRHAANVVLAGEPSKKTVFRWITTRRMGLKWDCDLDIFPGLVDFAALAKNPASFTRKQEWMFNPDDVELTGLHGCKSSKLSRWCSRLKNKDRDLDCRGKHPRWKFSFFDLIEIDGKIYITAATEKYQSPDDMHLPTVILVGRYIAPPKGTPLLLGGPYHGSMNWLEHRCYLIKTR